MIRFALPFIVLAGTATAQQMPGAHFLENWDLNEDAQVTTSEAAERRGDVFVTFDTNDDGFLDAKEYIAFDEARENDIREHAQPGKGLGRRAADDLALVPNDLNKDGKVSREEFVSRAETWIGMMDKNGDGVITIADFGRGQGKGGGQGRGKG
ncbi:EF hand [Pelagimonas phthalicica]|uniref:EF hand n=1 Tax=Pelagimonas phthalicica TaxID=1037362 RepID=A0A238J967_9RHOB|nr:EF-hand domain-containing protein [Pelagimonas phthalicica]TDS94569.1 EF hand domain-containing protein [Pelagimonas phthalicica]SMX26903.1 EF hand [Pelagimonas phthalicica]